MSNEQNVRLYYMLNHRIRGVLFHYKKIVILQVASVFFGKSIFEKHPDCVCENDFNNEQNVRGYYMSNQMNERLIILLQKKIVILASIFNSQSIFYCQN